MMYFALRNDSCDMNKVSIMGSFWSLNGVKSSKNEISIEPVLRLSSRMSHYLGESSPSGGLSSDRYASIRSSLDKKLFLTWTTN